MTTRLLTLALLVTTGCAQDQETAATDTSTQPSTTTPTASTTTTSPTELYVASLTLSTDIITVDWDSGTNSAQLTATIMAHGGGYLVLEDDKKKGYSIDWTLLDADGYDISPNLEAFVGDTVGIVYRGVSTGYWFYEGFTIRDQKGGLLMALATGDALTKEDLNPVTVERAPTPYLEAVFVPNRSTWNNTVDAFELIFTNAGKESVTVPVAQSDALTVDGTPLQVMNINATQVVNTHITDVNKSPLAYGVWR